MKNSYFSSVSGVFRTIRIGAFISGVNLLIQGVSFLVNNFIAKSLGNVSFAYLGILQSDYSIFCALADFGTATLILAFFGKQASKGKLLSHAFQLRYALTFASMILMILFAFIIRYDHPAFRGELILAFGLLFQHAFFDWYFICGKFWKKLLAAKILHTIAYSIIMSLSLFYFKVHTIEGVALSMVLAALPAWSFGATAALKKQIFIVTKRSRLFIKLMLGKAFPFALSSLASFAYLPLGLYAMDLFASQEDLAAYNYANKIILLASGLMVNFISSSLVTKHESTDFTIHIQDILKFTFFVVICTAPFWLIPRITLQLLFFATPIKENAALLRQSASYLSILSISLILQAIRMSFVATMLKEKRLWTYVFFIFIGGLLNALFVFGLPSLGFHKEAIPMFTLTGDAVFSAILLIYFIRGRRIAIH